MDEFKSARKSIKSPVDGKMKVWYEWLVLRFLCVYEENVGWKDEVQYVLGYFV